MVAYRPAKATLTSINVYKKVDVTFFVRAGGLWWHRQSREFFCQSEVSRLYSAIAAVFWL
jgi:hypothetical protein